MLSAPDNIRNSVQNFFEDPSIGIEAIPMKNKIENVLYSLITNGIISFDRPGSSYPQAAVTGYEKLGSRKFNTEGVQTSNQDTLKFYDPVFDEDGNLVKINPAEVIMPLPDYWIKPLLRWAKTNNLAKAIDMLNADIAVRPELYQFKGLRIPNQQLSSNDIFQVKKFNLPTVQNYIVIPTEMVIKTGGDFDIDKLNIYWAEDTQDKIFGNLTEDEYLELYQTFLEEADEVLSYEEFKKHYKTSVDRILLEQEKEIILHPRNAHHLLMPLTDEIFVKDIYNDLLDLGVIKPVSSSFFSSMLPSTNVKNTVVFVKGKYGVGPVALAITNAATNQADVLSINDFYNTQDGTVSPTKLLFEGMGQEYSLDNYTDNKGTVISEILSQLLTTQVDNVKNPTAVLMNINMQTLGVMLYLIRRKINPRSIVLFLQQPIIAKYLQYQRANESLFNKQADAESRAKKEFKAELSKANLIKKLLRDLGYKVDELPDVYTTVVGTKVSASGLESFVTPEGLDIDESKVEWSNEDVFWTINDNEMLINAKDQKFDKNQLSYLAYFLELQNQSRAFSDFQQTQNSDTKGLKDKQMLDETYEVNGRVFMSQIISEENVGRLNYRGVISPFYKYGRANYSIFNRFYGLSESLFGSFLTELKSNIASVQKGDGKDRVRQTIENDFMLFLVHHFKTNKSEFDKLMKGGSVAKRITDLKTKLPQNLVLKAFFPMINNSVDNSLGKPERMDNLRLFERELNELDNNDMRISLEEIQETDPELYQDIVKLLMFQTGLNISPFNYRSIVPVGLNKNRNEFNEFQYLYQDLLHDAMTEMKKQITSKTAAKDLFEQFKVLFAANNVKFLETSFSNKNYTLPLIKAWDRGSESWVLKPEKGNQEQPILGDAYHKQYFVELINTKMESKNKEEVKNILNEVFEDHHDVPAPIQETSVGKYELFPGVFANQGQTEALDLLEKFLDSNEQEFTLIGRGGTGKTTIIKKVLENLKNRSVMGVTVAHKAKKVLGRSIGKDKVKTFASATSNKMNESTGKFEPDMYARQQGRVPISQVDVVIVDEASMISPKMQDEIRTLVHRGTKVIYMGDNAQLPPVGESEDSPVFNNKNQYTLREKMRQAKTSPIIGVGSTIAENIESSNLKTVAIKSENRKSEFDEVSKSEVVFISEESQALDLMVEDIKNAKNNPDFVKAVTFNNENHNAPQSVKNLNSKIRAKLWGDKASNQLNVGEMLTAYDSYATVKNPTEDDMIIHNSEDFIVTAFSKRTARGSVTVVSKAKGERTFKFEYDVLDVELLNDEGQRIKGNVVEMIADSSKEKYAEDLAKLWKEDTQLAIALKSKFANLQYGYAITSHKAQGSTYTNTYVFEDNILGPTNAGDAITKNKSLYVAVSRPTTKLVMISERNEGVTFENGRNYLTEDGKKVGSLETDEFGNTFITPVNQPVQLKVEKSEPDSFINHSGGAYGGDTYWDLIGREFGVTNHKHYKDAGNANLSQQLRNKGVKAEILTKEQMDFARQKVKELLGVEYKDDLRGNLQVRNFYQVYNADAVYAIAKINNDNKSVSGGTNTAIQLGIKLNKPVYVWDINSETWNKFNSSSKNNLTPSAKGKMTFSYGSNRRSDIIANTTLEAIKNGERTATTRYESDGHIEYWRNLKIGDVIEWEGQNGEKVLVEVTKPLHKLVGSGKTAEQWSKLEGWSVEYFNSKVKSKLDGAWQIEYKIINNQKGFQKTDTPTLTKNFAGIGSRDIEKYSVLNKETNKWEPKKEYVGDEKSKKAQQAIRDVYQKTFSKNQTPSQKPSTINIYSTEKNGYEKLSNLADRKFKDKNGREYFSVEHAYQSWKSGSFDEETYKKYSKGGVKIAGNKGTKTVNNWNLNLMKRLIKLSLEQNPDIADLLVGTGTIPLTHTQDRTVWKTEFPRLLMEIRDELKGGYQTLFEADKSQSKYSPSLKMYEGFINLNQLYQGDEILPFIGESEYYRYLVPMLLKMNPKAQTVFTDDMRFVLEQLATARDMQLVMDMDRMPSGMSANSLNRNFINFDAKSKTVVHELVHLTLQKEYEKGTEFKTKIDELFSYAWDRQESDGTYGFTSPKEFLAEAMSNPDFMQELNEIKYKEETVWSYLMTLVSDFINNLLNVELKSDSVLAEVIRLSEQVLNTNISEIGKETRVDSTTLGSEILNNWSSYFPDFEWMNEAQRRMTAKLAEEGKITLTCNL